MSDTIEDLVAENARLKAVQPTGSKATLYVVSIIALAVIAAGFVLAVTFIRPEHDNTGIIATVIGIIAPVVMALLAGTVQQVHLAVNSRLSQLLELTSKAAKAEGKLVGATATVDAARAEGKAQGVEQERVRTDVVR